MASQSVFSLVFVCVRVATGCFGETVGKETFFCETSQQSWDGFTRSSLVIADNYYFSMCSSFSPAKITCCGILCYFVWLQSLHLWWYDLCAWVENAKCQLEGHWHKSCHRFVPLTHWVDINTGINDRLNFIKVCLLNIDLAVCQQLRVLQLYLFSTVI